MAKKVNVCGTWLAILYGYDKEELNPILSLLNTMLFSFSDDGSCRYELSEMGDIHANRNKLCYELTGNKLIVRDVVECEDEFCLEILHIDDARCDVSMVSLFVDEPKRYIVFKRVDGLLGEGVVFDKKNTILKYLYALKEERGVNALFDFE